MKNETRRSFLQKTACTIGYGLCAGISVPKAFAENNAQQNINDLTLKNVRLETGFIRDDFEVTGTKSDLFIIVVKGGKITEVRPNNDAVDAIDASGCLMLPAMKDMHIHLDKTWYGGSWKARSKGQRSVNDMIELEKQILPEMLKTSTERAESLIDLLQSNGTCFARSHVNIEPVLKLKSLENLQRALENRKSTFGAELVAFPQHGLFVSGSDSLMEEAAKAPIDFIGGLDPYTIDGSIEKPIDFTVQLALDHNKGIDIHLHEGGDSGYKTILYLIDKVNENPVLKGKTYISHCFALMNLQANVLAETAQKLADAGIGITTSVPFNRMPIPVLWKYGVRVFSGTDSVMDHWQSFGTGSMLQKANLMAQLYGCNGDLDISRCLRIATGGITPLSDGGTMQWPKAGDNADFILVKTSCSAEFVARQSEIKALYYKGRSVYG